VTVRENTSHPSIVTRIRRRLKAAAYSGPGRDRWQRPDQVLAALDLEPGLRVADLGAGGGYFTFKLARAVGPDGRVYAIDTDPDMTSYVDDQARRQAVTNVVTVTPPPDGPLVEGTVDLVIVVDAFHHLDDPAADLRRVASSLADGGRVAVIEPPPRWWLFGHATDPDQLRSDLHAAGYEVVAEHGFLPRQGMLIARPAD
jgi:SAM-dependent methyltransferase